MKPLTSHSSCPPCFWLLVISSWIGTSIVCFQVTAASRANNHLEVVEDALEQELEEHPQDIHFLNPRQLDERDNQEVEYYDDMEPADFEDYMDGDMRIGDDLDDSLTEQDIIDLKEAKKARDERDIEIASRSLINVPPGTRTFINPNNKYSIESHATIGIDRYPNNVKRIWYFCKTARVSHIIVSCPFFRIEWSHKCKNDKFSIFKSPFYTRGIRRCGQIHGFYKKYTDNCIKIVFKTNYIKRRAGFICKVKPIVIPPTTTREATTTSTSSTTTSTSSTTTSTPTTTSSTSSTTTSTPTTTTSTSSTTTSSPSTTTSTSSTTTSTPTTTTSTTTSTPTTTTSTTTSTPTTTTSTTTSTPTTTTSTTTSTSSTTTSTPTTTTSTSSTTTSSPSTTTSTSSTTTSTPTTTTSTTTSTPTTTTSTTTSTSSTTTSTPTTTTSTTTSTSSTSTTTTTFMPGCPEPPQVPPVRQVVNSCSDILPGYNPPCTCQSILSGGLCITCQICSACDLEFFAVHDFSNVHLYIHFNYPCSNIINFKQAPLPYGFPSRVYGIVMCFPPPTYITNPVYPSFTAIFFMPCPLFLSPCSLFTTYLGRRRSLSYKLLDEMKGIEDQSKNSHISGNSVRELGSLAGLGCNSTEFHLLGVEGDLSTVCHPEVKKYMQILVTSDAMFPMDMCIFGSLETLIIESANGVIPDGSVKVCSPDIKYIDTIPQNLNAVTCCQNCPYCSQVANALG
ncbi:hypothetical protein SK128_019523 [Halocaridina rubra]|uniref:Uncharacterized protein n=1 Tax=Halocaridina rubra TaxID=373956 RepID=A0AAN8ZZQ6_HALRR